MRFLIVISIYYSNLYIYIMCLIKKKPSWFEKVTLISSSSVSESDCINFIKNASMQICI